MADMWQKCPNCTGTGKLADGTVCPSCQGRGIVNVLTGLPPKEQVVDRQNVFTMPDGPNGSGIWPPMSPHGRFDVWAGEPIKTEIKS